jgi:hypothetical protein
MPFNTQDQANSNEMNDGEKSIQIREVGSPRESRLSFEVQGLAAKAQSEEKREQPVKDGVRQYKDGSSAVIENGLCQSWTHPGIGTTYYRWSNGQLNKIENPDGSSFRFEANHWQHYSKSGLPDAKPNLSLRVILKDGQAFSVKGAITEAVLNEILEKQANSDSSTPASEDDTIAISTTAAGEDTITSAAQTIRRHRDDPQAVAAAIRDLPPEDRGRLEPAYKKSSDGQDSLDSLLKLKGYEDALAAFNSRSEKLDLAWLEDTVNHLAKAPGDSQSSIISEHTLRKSFSSMSKNDFESLENEVQSKYGVPLDKWLKDNGASDETLAAFAIYRKGTENLTSDDFAKLAELALGAALKARQMASADLEPSLSSGSARLEAAEKQTEKALLLLKETFGGDDPRVVEARRKFAENNGVARLVDAFGNDSIAFRQARDYVELGKTRADTAIDLASGSFFRNDYGVELAVTTMTADERAQFRRGEELWVNGSGKQSESSLSAADRAAMNYYKAVHDAILRANDTAGDAILSTLRLEGHPSRRLNQTLRLEDLARNGHETLLGRLSQANGDRSAALAVLSNLGKEDFDLLRTDPVYRQKVYELIGGQTYNGTTLFTFNDAILLRKRLDAVNQAASYSEAQKVAGLSLRDAVQGLGFSQANDAGVYAAIRRSSVEDYNGLDPLDKQKLQERVEAFDPVSRINAQKMLQDLKQGRSIKLDQAQELDLLALRSKSPAEVANYLLELRQKDIAQFNSLVNSESTLAQERLNRLFPGHPEISEHLRKNGTISAEQLAQLNRSPEQINGVSANYGSNDISKAPTIDSAKFYHGIANLSQEQKKDILLLSQRASAGNEQSRAELARLFKGFRPEQRDLALAITASNDGLNLALEIRAQIIGDVSADDKTLVERFSALNEEQKQALQKQYNSRFHSQLSADWLAVLYSPLKDRVQLELANNSKDRLMIEANTLEKTSRGSYNSTTVIEGGLRVREAEQKFHSPLMHSADRVKLQQKVDDCHKIYGRLLQENEEAKRQYAEDVSRKSLELAGYAAAPLLPEAISLRPLVYAAAAGSLVKASIQADIRGDLGSKSEALTVIGTGGIEGIIYFGDARAIGKVLGGTTKKATQEAFELLSASSGREVVNLENQNRIATELSSLIQRKLKMQESQITQEEIENIIRRVTGNNSATGSKLGATASADAAREIRMSLNRAMPQASREIVDNSMAMEVEQAAKPNNTFRFSSQNAVVRAAEEKHGRRIYLSGQEIELVPGSERIIGRPDTSIRGDALDNMVSRQHARIRYDEQTGQMIITDQSTNGTYVRRAGFGDWKRIQGAEVRVNPGDEVRLGSTTGPEVKIIRLTGELDKNGTVRFVKADGIEWISPSGNRVFNDRAGITRVVDSNGLLQQVETPSGALRKMYYEQGKLMRVEMEDGGIYSRNGQFWQLKRNGIKSNFIGTVEVLEDGSIKVRSDGMTFSDVYRADGSKEFHLLNGRVNYYEARYDIEKARSLALVEQRFSPERQQRYQDMMSRFEERAIARGLTEKEIAKTYHQLNRLLNSAANALLGQTRRERLAEEILQQATNPHLIDQGVNGTCNVTVVEKRIYERQPSEAARVVVDAATSGKYYDITGSQVDLSRIPQALEPDRDSLKAASLAFDRGGNDLRVDGARTYASQIFQNTAVNVEYAHSAKYKVNGEDIIMYFKGVPTAVNRSGEQLVRFGRDSQNNLVRELKGEAPNLTSEQLADVHNRIINSNSTDFMLVNRAIAAPSGSRAIDSVRDLEGAILLLKQQNRLPAIVTVHTGHEPFYTASGAGAAGGSGGWHVVTVGDIFQGRDGKCYVTVFSNWGSGANFVGSRAIPIENLYQSTLPK